MFEFCITIYRILLLTHVFLFMYISFITSCLLSIFIVFSYVQISVHVPAYDSDD